MTTLKSMRPHIGIFGRRNVGKSAFVNAISNQDIAIVSDTPGTTTDPVRKVIEIHELGPVVLIDTAGIDDEGGLGEKRVQATERVLAEIDMAILLYTDWGKWEDQVLATLEQRRRPYLCIAHKADTGTIARPGDRRFSSLTREKMSDMLTAIRSTIPQTAWDSPSMLGDLIRPNDLVVLVTPVDIEAPQGRMILPQMQAVRDVLDHHAVSIVVKETELAQLLPRLTEMPSLVVTDSQAFRFVESIIPKTIPLTGFSILLARMKGDFQSMIEGTRAIDQLKTGDRILVLESCSHHASGDDIGRVKIPRWLNEYTGHSFTFDWAQGFTPPPRPYSDYRLVIQCGGCMMTRTQVLERIRPALEAHIPVTNYGMCIAYTQGIFERAIRPFVQGATL